MGVEVERLKRYAILLVSAITAQRSRSRV